MQISLLHHNENVSNMHSRKERNVLFNNCYNTLNIFYLQLNGVRYMVKDDSDERRNPLIPLNWLLFLISSKGSFR